MKGILNIEFILSVLVFLSTISFVTMMIVNSLPALRQESLSDDMKSSAYQLSSLLLNELSSQEPYNLSMDRIGNVRCNDYENVILNLTYLDGNEILYCSPTMKTEIKPEFILKRFAVVNGKIVIISITVIR